MEKFNYTSHMVLLVPLGSFVQLYTPDMLGGIILWLDAILSSTEKWGCYLTEYPGAGESQLQEVWCFTYPPLSIFQFV